MKLRVESDIFRGGSVLKGTVHSGFSEVRTHLELESDEPEEKLLMLMPEREAGMLRREHGPGGPSVEEHVQG